MLRDTINPRSTGTSGTSGTSSNLDNVDYIQFNTDPAIAFSTGQIHWDTDSSTLELDLEGGVVSLQVGQEMLVRATNKTGALIPNGALVYVSGGLGNKPVISLASATALETMATIGFATESIADNAQGYINTFGLVRGVNTSGVTAGSPIWLSSVPGEWVPYIPPTSPNWAVACGYVIYEHATEGVILCKTDIVPRLAWLSDTIITNLQDRNIVQWDSTAQSFINVDYTQTNFVGRSEWEQNGFITRDTSTLVWTDTSPDRTLSIQPVSDSFEYYVEGVKYTSTGDTIQIDNVEGIHIIYYNADGVIQHLSNPAHEQLYPIITQNAIVAVIYWDVSESTGIYIGDERHGSNMSPTTHAYLHATNGLQYLSGLTLTDIIVDTDGSLDAYAQFGNTSGEVADEDLYHSISSTTSTTGLPIYYLTGTSDWNKYVNPGFSVRTLDGTSTTRLAWNQYTGSAWQLTAVGDNNFCLYHIFATTEKDYPLISIMGQGTYLNKTEAQNAATTEIYNLVINNIVFPEFRPIATLIFKGNLSYTNSVNAFIVSTSDGGDYIDWRYQEISRITVGVSGTSGTSGTSAVESVYYDTTANEPVYLDEVRSKTLSTSIVTADFGSNSSTATNTYLELEGAVASNLNGFVLPFNATLVGISMSENLNSQTWTAEVRSNGSATVLDSLTITNAYSNYTYSSDTNFSAGDRIQVYINGTSIEYPHVTVFFRRQI